MAAEAIVGVRERLGTINARIHDINHAIRAQEQASDAVSANMQSVAQAAEEGAMRAQTTRCRQRSQVRWGKATGRSQPLPPINILCRFLPRPALARGFCLAAQPLRLALGGMNEYSPAYCPN